MLGIVLILRMEKELWLIIYISMIWYLFFSNENILLKKLWSHNGNIYGQPDTEYNFHEPLKKKLCARRTEDLYQ